MSNEKPDEFLSWRGRLGQPDALPEQGLDNPEVTWERLNARLGERLNARVEGIVLDGGVADGRRRRRNYRYGVAAAFLLLALIPAAWLYRGRSSAGKQGSPPVGKQVSGMTRQPANVDREAIAGMTIREKIPGARPDKHLPSEGSLSRISHLAGSDRRGRKTGSVTLSAIADRQGRVEGVALADSGVRLAVCTPPVKKALRVVSINEIDNPTAMRPMTTGPAVTIHWPSLPLRIHQVSRGSDFSPDTANLEMAPVLLKIKLNPQNP
jgi:hypothetical protein